MSHLRILSARASGKSERKPSVTGSMLPCGSLRPGLRMLLSVHRSVFVNTIVLTAMSTAIATALCVGKQPGKSEHPNLLNALISFAGVTSGMR